MGKLTIYWGPWNHPVLTEAPDRKQVLDRREIQVGLGWEKVGKEEDIQ